MRDLSDDFTAHLRSGATSLCRCWTLTRRDGAVLGFTDHDRALEFDDIVFESAAGFTASEIPSSLGLNIDTAEITGALNSDTLDPKDLDGGLYDNARVGVYLVNWSDPSQRVLLEVGVIGEIARQGASFTAEMRSLAHTLDQERGRSFQSGCDAQLGDGRCKFNLNSSGNRSDGEIGSVAGARTFVVTGISSIDAGRCERGFLAWTSGANAGSRFDIRSDRLSDAGRVLELWQQPPNAVEPSDAFTVTVGCDKTFRTCKSVFNNTANFRGFPHMPGMDFALSYVRRGTDSNDGGSILS